MTVLIIPLLFLAAESADPTDKAAFEKVCSQCHTSSMITDMMTRDEWSETIETMITIGAKGTVDEFARVRRYLAQTMTRVNVNVADAAEIAPVLELSEAAAQAVVDYRAKHGSFENLDALGKVPGINVAALARRKERIVFR